MKNYSDDRVTAGESYPPRVNRGLLRFGLLMLAGLVAVLAPTLASAKPKPDLVVRSVLEPVPPGAQPGGGMFLQATVKARNGKGRKAQVVFYLAKDSVPGADDVQIASASIGSSPGSNTAVEVAAHVPAEMPPGFYFVLACAGAGNCAASEGTIQVVGQRLSTVSQGPGVISVSPPANEYFPEVPSAHMTVGSPFACPFSFHGQWPSNCVYVTTGSFPTAIGATSQGLMYCPIGQPYPYEVAIGFDPLWNDLSDLGGAAGTNAVSGTKYKIDGGGLPLSYAGLDPSDPLQRGYGWFHLTNRSEFTVIFQVEYLCSDRAPTSTLP